MARDALAQHASATEVMFNPLNATSSADGAAVARSRAHAHLLYRARHAPRMSYRLGSVSTGTTPGSGLQLVALPVSQLGSGDGASGEDSLAALAVATVDSKRASTTGSSWLVASSTPANAAFVSAMRSPSLGVTHLAAAFRPVASRKPSLRRKGSVKAVSNAAI